MELKKPMKINIMGILTIPHHYFPFISDNLQRGERYGMIRLGSRVDIRVPAEGAQPLVESNLMVLAGTTPLFRREQLRIEQER